MLYPALKTFLLEAATDQAGLRLVLDSHVTLAFAAGAALHIKSGCRVELEQRTTGRRIWAADDASSDPTWPTLTMDVVELDPRQPDLSVAVGLTHDIGFDVRGYVQANLPSVGRLMILKPSVRCGAQSVTCGRHAFELADATISAVRAARSADITSITHLFIAGPNAFTFFLGQRQPAFGRVRLYEFDLEGGRDRSYTPAITLPMTSPMVASSNVQPE